MIRYYIKKKRIRVRQAFAVTWNERLRTGIGFAYAKTPEFPITICRRRYGIIPVFHPLCNPPQGVAT